MLHSRGELLLMLDADGATKINDLEKLESQVCQCIDFSAHNILYLILASNQLWKNYDNLTCNA